MGRVSSTGLRALHRQLAGHPPGLAYYHKNTAVALGKTLPGLKSFYMAGQWLEPGGGVPTAALSGRDVVKLICSKGKKPFVNVEGQVTLDRGG